jgi:hypothetical protein
MIVALTTASLDITLGVAWWTIKQVFSGAIYLGTYLFSESSSSKKNKILGDDPNFVPHAFQIVELELTHSHITLSNNNKQDETDLIIDDDYINISKSESILTSKDKYFKVPLKEIIHRKEKLPFWFIPFLNTYPLTNYAIVNNENNTFATRILDEPIFSPFTLSKHLDIKNKTDEMYVYIKKDDVENMITLFLKSSNN